MTAIISLMSMGLGISYWEELGATLKLRGGAVMTKSDYESEVQLASSEDVINGAPRRPSREADRFRAYNRSPYERHWPGFVLDPWMRKEVDVIPSKKKEVCLMHIGKVSFVCSATILILFVLVKLISFASVCRLHSSVCSRIQCPILHSNQ